MLLVDIQLFGTRHANSLQIMRSRLWPLFVLGLGVFIFGSSLWHLVHLGPVLPVSPHLVVDVFLIGGSGIAITYAGLWHRHNGPEAGHQLRSLGWLLAGIVLFFTVTSISLYAGSDTVTTAELLEVTHISVAVGASVGLLVGTIELRAIRQSRTAARAEERTEALQRERERIVRVNELLRHYVLNSLTVITGYIHEESVTKRPDRDAVATRIDTIETTVEHVRALSTALQDESPRTTYALEDLVSTIVGDIDPVQQVRFDLSSELPPVFGTVVLERALGLLFEAFFDALDPGTPVRITTGVSEMGVTLSVSAAGEGSSVEDSLSDAGPEADLKFTLASELVDGTGTISFDEGNGDCEILFTPEDDIPTSTARRETVG